MTDFNYIIENIENAVFVDYPFPHLEITNFLSREHLDIILNDKQIHFEEMSNIDLLYNELMKHDWGIQFFPGCTTNWSDYLKYLTNKNKFTTKNPVEGIGVTFRLKSYKNKLIKKLIKFMNSDNFHQVLKNKFGISNDTNIISAIQKNLSGYEISPHPDIRKKCLTYLLNINNEKIETLDCHTHLLEFESEYKYIGEYWKTNPHVERCWVPWNWCRSIKTINKNNTMVILKPDSSPPTLHAIKLNYDHLKYQRTQIYGNLMYKNVSTNLEDSNFMDLMNI